MINPQLLQGGVLAVLQVVTLLLFVKAVLRQGGAAAFVWGLLHYGGVFGAVAWLLRQSGLQLPGLLGLLIGYSLVLTLGLALFLRYEQRMKLK